ncbi:phosphate ABC transporter membrane protein 1, PhoT family [[Leptolyngbya] sp. PCC 7376]|uniref:phosphate ABC transporter permease subunit PstC n=1 Tax=[Leptolyngbya] sp. PCC 7376 TaxID=111781 RepID=UPI00029F37EF|nr:phosphate ABC transporter permease subunit PstC [[Leptolyngbya] sp. PCC 7376]AFY37389.1 phosphate ABC transporter membrane protein 1, PhoT family [[Leptolyngbya] sp. PCC 7376]
MSKLPRAIKQNRHPSLNADKILLWVLQGTGLVSGILVLLILLFLLRESFPIFQKYGLTVLFSDERWQPTAGQFNILPMILGTLWTTVGAIAVALPLGILSAIFCQFYAPKCLANWYRRLLELLAGIPSVVYGFWGLVVLVPLITKLQPPGTSLLAGIVILALMILPTVALIADASLGKVPTSYLRGAKALGISRWGMVWGVAVPAAKSGLVTAGILAAGRALGETMAVLMVCGNVVKVPISIFDPVRTLTANIALEMAYALGDHRAALFVSGLCLMVVVMLLILAADWVVSEEGVNG